MIIQDLRARLHECANAETATILQRFFKTGPGEYGEGDRFLGIKVPVLRKLAREFRELSIEGARELLHSPIHEERLIALLILMKKYDEGNEEVKAAICALYLSNTKSINNWDLVDLSAQYIVGHYLQEKDKGPLLTLARSRDLWERRISIMATFCYIRRCRFDETLRIARMLLSDQEDLIHKAVGWMLREVGKRDLKTEEDFLKKYHQQMPRTMLRYAIERFPEEKKNEYRLKRR